MILLNLANVEVLSTDTSLGLFREREIFNRIGHSQVGEEFVVGESEQRDIKLGECSHHFVVNIEGQSLIELVWLDPGNLLSHNFHSVIDALDGEECFGEALGHRAIEHEISV